jgi:hypothetical protein
MQMLRKAAKKLACNGACNILFDSNGPEMMAGRPVGGLACQPAWRKSYQRQCIIRSKVLAQAGANRCVSARFCSR